MNTSTAAVAQFQGFSTRLFGNAATANPYHYGHLPGDGEPDGTGSIVSTSASAASRTSWCR